MPSVKEIYTETIRPLSSDEREELIHLILQDLSPASSHIVQTIDQLEAQLLDGLDSPRQFVTNKTWELSHSELDRRLNLSAE